MEQGGGGSVRRRVPDRDAVCAQPGVDRFERLARGRIAHGRVARSADRRVGKECVSTCSSRWSPSHYQETIQHSGLLSTLVTLLLVKTIHYTTISICYT